MPSPPLLFIFTFHFYFSLTFISLSLCIFFSFFLSVRSCALMSMGHSHIQNPKCSFHIAYLDSSSCSFLCLVCMAMVNWLCLGLFTVKREREERKKKAKAEDQENGAARQSTLQPPRSNPRPSHRGCEHKENWS